MLNNLNEVYRTQFEIIKERLKEKLKGSLPGEKAHRLLLPPGRELTPAADAHTIIQSSVLMLLFPNSDKLSTCLIQRPVNMRTHGGQIAFPGGRYEPSDKDLMSTALRESGEEIGTHTTQVEILGGLTPLYVSVSNFTINPFIGWSNVKPDFKIDPHEVNELFIVPVEELLHHASFQVQQVTTVHGTFEAPGFYSDRLFVWGATAMIIAEFIELYKS